jgi:thiosulfate sulfurtransferase
MNFKRIDVAEARRLIDQENAQVVDVRDSDSYRAGHIADARSIDEQNVQSFIEEADRERPLIVCCYHGNMSQGAADYFGQNGFRQAYSLDGGYEAWRHSGEAARG